MKRKNLFTSAVIITALSLSICLSGCGKQGVEPVMAATLEETLTSEVTTEEETESSQESETDEVETESVAVQDYTLTEMNKEMQATQNAVTYETPSADTAVGGVKQDEIVKVTGIVEGSDWYQIDQEGTTSFIESIYLKELEQPEVQQPAEQKQDGNNNQNQSEPRVETPKENPQPPVVNPQPPVTDPSAGTSELIDLPDGGVILPDGTEIHPGDKVGGGMIWGGTSAAWGMSDYY